MSNTKSEAVTVLIITTKADISLQDGGIGMRIVDAPHVHGRTVAFPSLSQLTDEQYSLLNKLAIHTILKEAARLSQPPANIQVEGEAPGSEPMKGPVN